MRHIASRTTQSHTSPFPPTSPRTPPETYWPVPKSPCSSSLFAILSAPSPGPWSKRQCRGNYSSASSKATCSTATLSYRCHTSSESSASGISAVPCQILTSESRRRYADHVGIHYVLCRKLRQFPYEDIEFFLPQLCHLVITVNNESVALEEFLLDLCEESVIAALLVCFLACACWTQGASNGKALDVLAAPDIPA